MPKKIKVFIVKDNEDERIFMKEGFDASGLYSVVAEAANVDEMNEMLKIHTVSPELVI